MATDSDGITTTEYERSKSSGKWGVVALLLGMVITMLSSILPQITSEHQAAGIIAGSIVSVLGIVQKTLVDLGYIKSRTAVKTQQMDKAMPSERNEVQP